MDSPTISASKRRGRKELFFEKLPFLRAHEKGDSTNDSLQPLEIPATTPHPPKNGVVWGGMLKKTPPSFTHHKGKQRRCLHKIFSLFLPPVCSFWGRKGKYCDYAGRRSACVLSLARKAKPTPPSLISEKRKETLCLKSGCGYFLPRNLANEGKPSYVRAIF